MFLAQKGGAEAGRPRPGGTEPFPALSPSAAYLLGGRLAVVGLVLLAQEEAGHLHLGGTAVGDIAIAARLAGSGLHLGVGFAWGGKREAGRSDRAPAGAGTKLLSALSSPALDPPPPPHPAFGRGSCRRCGIGWRPAWARGPAPRLPSLCAASAREEHWGWAHPAAAGSAGRSRTRTGPWERLEGEGCLRRPPASPRETRPCSATADHAGPALPQPLRARHPSRHPTPAPRRSHLSPSAQNRLRSRTGLGNADFGVLNSPLRALIGSFKTQPSQPSPSPIGLRGVGGGPSGGTLRSHGSPGAERDLKGERQAEAGRETRRRGAGRGWAPRVPQSLPFIPPPPRTRPSRLNPACGSPPGCVSADVGRTWSPGAAQRL